jgi:hypothetical protein
VGLAKAAWGCFGEGEGDWSWRLRSLEKEIEKLGEGDWGDWRRETSRSALYIEELFFVNIPSLAHAQFRENRASQRGRVHAPDFASVVSLDHQEQWFARPLVIEKRRERVRVRGEHLERLVAVVEDYFF